MIKKKIQRWDDKGKADSTVYWNFIWATKFNKEVLTGDLLIRLKVLFKDIAESLSCNIEKMDIQSNVVRMFVKGNSVTSPHFFVQQCKGKTSGILKKEYPYLQKSTSIWTRYYFCESIGEIDELRAKKFLERQIGK